MTVTEPVHLELADEAIARSVLVLQREANEEAIALYRRRGFRPVGEREAAPDLFITELERRPAGHRRDW